MTPHPEGGHFVETWRGPDRGDGRASATAIHFLLRAGERSHWHRVDADEIWHFYAGEPLELLAYEPAARRLTKRVLDSPGRGTGAIGVIPSGVWQAARSLGKYSLVGCTVSPGFEFSGFRFVDALADHHEHFVGELAEFAALL